MPFQPELKASVVT